MKQTKRKKVAAVSLAFWLAVPSYFFLGGICIFSALILFPLRLMNSDVWPCFAFGCIGSVALLSSAKTNRLSVFVHELKHGFLALLYGGSIKSFSVGASSGHVEYEIEKARQHSIPIIGMAPYCFPLFSLPILILGMFFETDYLLPLSLALGASVGADFVFAYNEIDPRQTDFQDLAGGFFSAACFIAGALFVWGSICFLWLVAGRAGFVYAALVALKALHAIALSWNMS